MAAAMTLAHPDNHLLAALPAPERERLLSDMERVQLPFGETLYRAGDQTKYVYFPLESCVISLVSAMESGASAEVGLIGNEGMVGLSVFFGADRAIDQAVVQLAGVAWRVRAKVFQDKFLQSRVFRDLLHLYTQARMAQTAQLAACNRFHRVEERLARWLLSMHDRVVGDDIKSTHELISFALGVRRSGVSIAAAKFLEMGLIEYRRGSIRILDRDDLEAASCECYEVVKAEFDRLLIADLTKNMISGRAVSDDTGEFNRATGEREVALERLREINSRLILAGLREQEARDEAEAANTAKDDFLATLSHELRTPLAAVVGWSRMLRSRKLDKAAAARALEIIERNAETQTQLVEHLLDISRIASGKLQIELLPVNLAGIIKAAIDTIGAAAETKGVKLESDLDANFIVSGDKLRLQQVVLNLLANAVKFTPEAGSVRIRLEAVDSHAILTISDTGNGIKSDFLPQVFDRFRQADTQHTRGGLGLGLAIARQMVELHGGSIMAESTGDGQGATFTINLPLAVKKGGQETCRPLNEVVL